MSEKIATRNAFGDALVKLGGKYKNIVVLDADLSSSVKTGAFAKQFGERHFNFGIAEANMVSTAAGMAVRGKLPFAASFAVFVPGRCYDQIRCSVAYPNMNVKLVGSHGGIFTGEDGATHQAVEDLNLMRGLPNMKVFCPADYVEGVKMMETMVNDFGPTYLRLGRGAVPVLYDDSYEFKIGQGNVLKDGDKVVIFAIGTLVGNSLEAAKKLDEQGISTRVVNLASLKPIDEDLIVECAKECEMVVTSEDHSVIGGLGSAVCEVLSTYYSKKVHRIGMPDKFGESGTAGDLYLKYGFDVDGIKDQVMGWWEVRGLK